MKLADTSALAAAMRGPVLTAADPAYDAVRKVWNGMIDRRPAAPVQRAIAAGRRSNMPFHTLRTAS